MSTDGIFGVVTFGRSLNQYCTAGQGWRVAVDGDGIPMSVAGHLFDIDKNNNKAYAVQVCENTNGTRECFALYGRIGARPSRASTRSSESEFSRIVSDKFGVCGGMKYVMTQKPKGQPYTIAYYEFSDIPLAPVAAQATPEIITVTSGKSVVARTSVIVPKVYELLAYILSAASVSRSMRRGMEKLEVTVSGNSAPALSTIMAAKTAHANGMAVWASFPAGTEPPDAAKTGILQYFGEMMRLIPMQSGERSVCTKVMEAAKSYSNWVRIGKVLDLMEQASLSIQAERTNIASGAIAPPAPAAPPAPTAPQPKTTKYPLQGVHIPYENPSCAAIGIGLRPCGFPTHIKDADALEGDPVARAYADLKCDVVEGNSDDYRICALFTAKSTSIKSFDCFAIYPYVNETRAARFAGGKSVLLVHGTNMSAVKAILGSGLDVARCSGGRLGAKRIYMADNITKSEGYAGMDENPAHIDCKYFFIAECLFSGSGTSVKTTTQDLGWTSVESDQNTIIYAKGTGTLGAMDETKPDGTPQALQLNSVIGKPVDATRGYLGTQTTQTLLPGKTFEFPLSAYSSSFDKAEYTFGSNDLVMLRYLIVAHY